MGEYSTKQQGQEFGKLGNLDWTAHIQNLHTQPDFLSLRMKSELSERVCVFTCQIKVIELLWFGLLCVKVSTFPLAAQRAIRKSMRVMRLRQHRNRTTHQSPTV